MTRVLEMPGMHAKERVAEHVKELIRRPGYPRGTRLPSYQQLCAELDLSYVTVKRGMDLLEAEGIIDCIKGKGSFVNRELSREGRSLKTLGLIHQASHGYLFSTHFLQEIMRGIGGSPSGQFDLNIFTMREEGFVTAAQLADRHVDGVILLGVEADAFLAEFATWGIPAVVVDHAVAGVPLDCVACDNAAGAREAIARLAQQGHRHIRYFGRHPDQKVLIGGSPGRPMAIVPSDAIERRAAVAREVASRSWMRYDEILFPWFPYAELDKEVAFRAAQIARWRTEADRPTAFVAESDTGAIALIEELGAQGVRVPDDVSVCAVAGSGMRSDGVPRITQNRFDFAGMGRKAVELLRRRCEHPDDALEPAVYRVGFEWMAGSTCGARA